MHNVDVRDLPHNFLQIEIEYVKERSSACAVFGVLRAMV